METDKLLVSLNILGGHLKSIADATQFIVDIKNYLIPNVPEAPNFFKGETKKKFTPEDLKFEQDIISYSDALRKLGSGPVPNAHMNSEDLKSFEERKRAHEERLGGNDSRTYRSS